MTKKLKVQASLQAVLKPLHGSGYKTRAEIITAFQNGGTFIHDLMGDVMPVNKWSYVVGDFIKFKFDNGSKACFYRIIASDLST